MAKKKRTGPSGEIHGRARLLHVLFLLGAMFVVGKVLYIQNGPEAEGLKEKGEQSIYSRDYMEALRGNILDRNSRLLATTIPEYEIWMDFKGSLADSVFDNNVDALARELAAFFGGRSEAEFLEFLTRTRRIAKAQERSSWTVRLPVRRVDYEEQRIIAQFPIFNKGQFKGGYLPLRKEKRVYPHGIMAKRAIGSIDTNTYEATAGLELSFDRYLRGVDGLILRQVVSGDIKVPVPDPANVEPVDGFDVVTTLDMELQEIAQTALIRQLEAENADWGTVVLMEVATGEVHAMANVTRRRPGEYYDYVNYAVGYPMEPGSTYKLASLIALIEDGGLSLNATEFCENGRYTYLPKAVIRDDVPHGTLTLRQMFEKSSNIGFVKLTDRVYGSDHKRFFDYLRSIGMGDRTGIEIPGERSMNLTDPGAGDKSKFVMVAHGYGTSVSALRTLMLYNAVANDGVMMRPRLVKELRRLDRTVWEYAADTVNPAICSPRTLRLVRECLEGVMTDGTGRRLQSPHYKAAAKTGTAQVSIPGWRYGDPRGGRNYLASIAGYFPAENPRYSIVVAIRTYHGPQNNKKYHGGDLAGPVFKEIADKVVAVRSKWDGITLSERPLRYAASAQDFKSGRADLLGVAAGALGARAEIPAGFGDWVYVGKIAESGRASLVRRDPWDEERVEGGEADSLGFTAVPDVGGMGLRDALWVLESSGFEVTFGGTGAVVAQKPSPGLYEGPVERIRLELSH